MFVGNWDVIHEFFGICHLPEQCHCYLYTIPVCIFYLPEQHHICLLHPSHSRNYLVCRNAISHSCNFSLQSWNSVMVIVYPSWYGKLYIKLLERNTLLLLILKTCIALILLILELTTFSNQANLLHILPSLFFSVFNLPAMNFDVVGKMAFLILLDFVELAESVIVIHHCFWKFFPLNLSFPFLHCLSS